MYVERPSLKLPADQQKIWRYMSFTKFVSMLDSGKLHFARADTFIDKFESAIPALKFGNSLGVLREVVAIKRYRYRGDNVRAPGCARIRPRLPRLEPR